MKPKDILSFLDSVGLADGYTSKKIEVEKALEIERCERLEDLLKGWSGATGWLARQSGVEVYRQGCPRNPQGQVIFGELTRGVQSIQIRRLPEHWIVTKLTEGRGEACLVDEVRQITLEHGVAVYQRYWKIPADGAAHVFAWRFAGFENLGSKAE